MLLAYLRNKRAPLTFMVDQPRSVNTSVRPAELARLFKVGRISPTMLKRFVTGGILSETPRQRHCGVSQGSDLEVPSTIMNGVSSQSKSETAAHRKTRAPRTLAKREHKNNLSMSKPVIPDASQLGIQLPNGCLIAHGAQGSNVKRPFADIPDLEMHEMSTGITLDNEISTLQEGTPRVTSSFHGQFGFIPFTTAHRLPRHVHIAETPDKSHKGTLITERILVLDGVALVQLNEQLFIIPPKALVSIASGVPHTWTACPPGVRLPDSTTSDGSFLMVYEYEAPTGFFPTEQLETLSSVEDYKRFTGDLEDIRFPCLTPWEVVEQGTLIWNGGTREAELLQG